MNFGTPVPLLLGIFMVICAVALFFIERLKPGYERDTDKVYAILFLISGVFLLGNLTMDLIPSFQQMLMVGMLVSLTIQNINSRTPNPVRSGAQGDGGDYGGYRPPSRGGRPCPVALTLWRELYNLLSFHPAASLRWLFCPLRHDLFDGPLPCLP